MKVIGIIPARLKSTRLADKALVDIEGLPMVVHVLKRAQMSKVLSRVFVATDSQRIKDAVESSGGEAVMTSPDHQTGTDRLAEAAKDLNADIIVNVQGDEPLLDPEHIDSVVKPLIDDPSLQVSALVTPYTVKNSPSDIKAVLDLNNNIMYCSRADIPGDARSRVDSMWKMSFIIPMRKKFLMEFAGWGQSPLEKMEFIEHLRIIEHGVKFRAVPVDHAHISVDTPEDLIQVRKLMKTDKIKSRYLAIAKQVR
jgi:3-deoxy-manno-octulosonate cytidylyltransferase (CMP-KDO synthetase)